MLDNGTRFVANFKYSVKPEVSTNPTADGQSEFANLNEGAYTKFDSQCDKSMVGFVQSVPGMGGKSTNSSMIKHEIKCFYAEQVTHYDLENVVQVKTDTDTE